MSEVTRTIFDWNIGTGERTGLQNTIDKMRKARGELFEHEREEIVITKAKKRQQYDTKYNKNKDWTRIEEAPERECLCCEELLPSEEFPWKSLGPVSKTSVRCDYCFKCISNNKARPIRVRPYKHLLKKGT